MQCACAIRVECLAEKIKTNLKLDRYVICECVILARIRQLWNISCHASELDLQALSPTRQIGITGGEGGLRGSLECGDESHQNETHVIASKSSSIDINVRTIPRFASATALPSSP